MKRCDSVFPCSLPALIYLLSALLSAVSLAEEGSTATVKRPIIACKVTNPLDASRGTPANPFPVSNIEYIRLKVSISGDALGLPVIQPVTNDSQFADCGTNRGCIAISC